MKYVCFLLSIMATLPIALWAQSSGQRGATAHNIAPPKTGKVYALVIGISKYQDLPSLKYADRDAESFVDFLKSKSGGNVPTDNIKILTDEDATRSNFWVEYSDLIDRIKEGDMFYVYFAGHGDIEQKISEGDPLLLLSKSYKQNYIAGGEYISLSDLRRYLGAISQKGITVVFIADACHSGAMLSGGNTGREATVVALQQSWDNEIKFLSCQPSEVSEENVKWGGGRGVFSYVLEQGLKGLADENNDSVVTLREIKRFLEAEVPKQTNEAQNPSVIGDLKKVIAHIDWTTLTALRSNSDSLLAGASPEIKRAYQDFTAALKEGNLLHPEGASAMDFFRKIERAEAPEALKRTTKRDFVSALQDGAMLFIQSQLDGQKEVDGYNQKVVNDQLNKWHTAIEHLSAAIAVLGEDHYLTPSYKARKLYLEAYLLYFKMSNYTREYTIAHRDSCIQKLEDAVKLEENASYAYYLLGEVYAFTGQEEQAKKYYEKYLKLNPKDGYAYIGLASIERRWNNPKRADSLTAVAVAVGSNKMDQFMSHVGGYYYGWGELDSAKVYFKRALTYNPKLMAPYLNLGVMAKAEKDYLSAQKYDESLLQIDSTYAWAYNNLANVYVALKQTDKAIACYAKAIQYDSLYHVAYTNWAILYEDEGKQDEAFRLFHLSKSIEPYYKSTYWGIGNIHYNRGDYDSAYLYFNATTQLDTAYAQGYYWQGKTLAKKGEKDRALYYFEEAVRCDSANLDYWNGLATAFQDVDSTDLARLIFQKKVLAKDSTDTTPYIQIGNMFYAVASYDSAQFYYHRAVHFDSTSHIALYNLGLIQSNLSKYDSAISYFKRAYHVDSNYTQALESWALALYNQKRYEASKAIYLQLLQKDTAFRRDAYYRLGNCYNALGDSANAVASFQKILMREKDLSTIFQLGVLYNTKNNFPEARKWFSQIENEAIYRPYVLSQYASIAEADSNYEEALTYYQQALESDSLDPFNWNSIGYIMGKYLKKVKEGRAFIEHAITIDTANRNSSYSYLAHNYFMSGDTLTSLAWYFKAMEKNPADLRAVYDIACTYSLMGKAGEALHYLEKSFEGGYDDFEHVNTDEDLNNIRGLKSFKALVEKYQAQKKKG